VTRSKDYCRKEVTESLVMLKSLKEYLGGKIARLQSINQFNSFALNSIRQVLIHLLIPT